MMLGNLIVTYGSVLMNSKGWTSLLGKCPSGGTNAYSIEYRLQAYPSQQIAIFIGLVLSFVLPRSMLGGCCGPSLIQSKL
jgi:hypothetical protein